MHIRVGTPRQQARDRSAWEMRMGIIPVAALSATASAATTIVTAWLRARSRERQERFRSSSKAVQALPPGSRVVDLGRHGTIIDVGGRAPGSSDD
jgi:hypothetical protein